jgi:hypothetical protein
LAILAGCTIPPPKEEFPTQGGADMRWSFLWLVVILVGFRAMPANAQEKPLNPSHADATTGKPSSLPPFTKLKNSIAREMARFFDSSLTVRH